MGEDCNYSWDDARLKSRRLPGLHPEMGPAPAHRRHWRPAQHVNQFALLPVHPKNLLNRHGPSMFLETMVRTYEEAGVSQDEKAAHIAALVAALTYRRKGLGKPLTKIGHFTGLVDFGSYALSLCTDSVGTKVLVAKEMRKWDTIGIDCVAMNVNDMICIGAEPLAFVDYVAISDYDREVARQIGIGLNRGAELADVSIIGGEVAVVPELVRELDLAGTCFGAVRKTKIIDGRAIRPRDVIIGVPSTGIHANGLTLARRGLAESALTVLDPVGGTGRSWGEELLEPTAIYVRPVLRALRRSTAMATRRKPTKEPSKPTKETSPPTTASGQTGSGLPLDVALTPAKESALDFASKIGFPGEPPFTRGIRATMYRGRLWTMRQYAGLGTAKETNRRFQYLLAHGNEGLSVAFDLPTQMGYDSDAPLARGEVGRVGVAISTLDDMGLLFDGLPLDRVSTSMTINATAPILLALYIAVAEGRKVRRGVLCGTVQNDILKEYIARSTYIYPPAPSMRLALDVIEFCTKEVPRWNAISVSGYHIREAGATAVQEIAFTLANGIAYLDAAVARGLDVDAIAPQISFFFNAHIDLLEEVAKFRAARRLWASVMRDRFHARQAESMALRFHAQTAGVTLTAQQPESNAVRVAVQALAAVLGGAQSLHTNSMDEALSLPSEKAVRLALRTQQILAHESGVANTVDPAGGSFVIESLTDRLESEAAALILQVDRHGGMLKAIDSGWVQVQVADCEYRYQMELERCERTVVGVNAYTEAGEAIPVPKTNPKLAAERARALEGFRKSRDRKAVARSLGRLEAVARGAANTMPAILEAVRAKATLGEISDVLRSVFGTYRPRQNV